MNGRNITNLIASAIIGILVISCVMIPIIDAGTKTNMDVSQNSTIYFNALKDFDGEVIVEPTGPALIVNGEAYTVGFVASSNYYVSYYSHTSWYDCVVYSVELGKVTGVDLMTIHEDGTITIVADDEELTTTVAPDYVFIPDVDGKWGSYRNANFNVTAGQVVYYQSVTNFGTTEAPEDVLWFAKMKNGKFYDLESYYLDSLENSFSETDMAITDKNVTIENMNYRIHSSIGGTWNGLTKNDSYAHVFAPILYYEETQEQSIINSMFALIPLIASAGLVMVGIYIFISRK